MKPWTHPGIGLIEPLPEHLKPTKVWKHFYDGNERWDRLTNTDVEARRCAAEDLVGVSRETHSRLPRRPTGEARQLLLRDHDDHYGPAYWAELKDSETVWTEIMDAAFRQHALTPQSVYVAVELKRDDPACVVTAFRPQSGSSTVNWDEKAFRRHAESYFKRKTGMETFATTITEELRRASASVPGTVQKLWFLASAVGFGRTCVENAELLSALETAETALSQAPQHLVAELRDTIQWDASMDELAEGLKDERPEELEHALSTSEEMLAVAVALGDSKRVRRYTDEIALLLAWVPAEWSFLMKTAAARLRAFADAESDNPLVRMWTAVEDAAVGASLREAPAERVPAARYTDALLGTSRWGRWIDAIAKVGSGSTDRLKSWVSGVLDSLEITAPVPLMGALKPASDVRSVTSAVPPHHRVFVVDDDYPDGADVTEHFNADGSIWQLEADDALLVLIASTEPIPGDNLAEVLEQARNSENVLVKSQELNQPK